MPSRRRLLVAVVAATALVAVVVIAAWRFGGADARASARAAAAPGGASAVRAVPARASRGVPADLALPRLRRLTPPDLLVSLSGPASAVKVTQLRRRHGIAAVAVLDRGTVRLPSGHLDLVGADPQEIRSFTPRFTAISQPLWRSVVSGELTLSYARAARMPRELGAVEPVATRAARVLLRVGAFASLGLGHAQGLVDRATARSLRLPEARAVLVSGPHLSVDAIRADVRAVFGSHAVVHVLRPHPVDQTVMSAYARETIPPAYLSLYRAAATTCPGLPWTVLAAIGAVETGHGADTRTSSKGAMGPMQFLPSTFVAYAVDGDGDGVANIQDPADAVYSAARYLCLWGAGRGGQSLADAIWAYNHAAWYVREVIQLAVAYT